MIYSLVFGIIVCCSAGSCCLRLCCSMWKLMIMLVCLCSEWIGLMFLSLNLLGVLRMRMWWLGLMLSFFGSGVFE